MPFTYSITVGIGAGFLAYVLIKVVVGKASRGQAAHVGHRRRCSSSTSRSTRSPTCSPERRVGDGARRRAGNTLARVMSYANDMPTVEKASRTDTGLASELRMSVMRLRRRLAGERHPDNELSLNAMAVLAGLYRHGDLTVGELAGASGSSRRA